MTVDLREVTSVHEAGHAVVALHLAGSVGRMEIVGPEGGEEGQSDITTHAPGAGARVAVAGYLAVGVVLGAEAEAFNRQRDRHELDDSDLSGALRHADDAGIAEADVISWLEGLDAEIRTLLQTPEKHGAVISLAEDLYECRTFLDEVNVLDAVNRAHQEWIEAGSPT